MSEVTIEGMNRIGVAIPNGPIVYNSQTESKIDEDAKKYIESRIIPEVKIKGVVSRSIRDFKKSRKSSIISAVYAHAKDYDLVARMVYESNRCFLQFWYEFD